MIGKDMANDKDYWFHTSLGPCDQIFVVDWFLNYMYFAIRPWYHFGL